MNEGVKEVLGSVRKEATELGNARFLKWLSRIEHDPTLLVVCEDIEVSLGVNRTLDELRWVQRLRTSISGV